MRWPDLVGAQKLSSWVCKKSLANDAAPSQVPVAMKSHRFFFITLLALTGALAVPVVRADDEAAKDKPVSKQALKKYDKDGDGKLNAEEEAAMKADREKARQERAEKRAEERKKYDKDGNGKLNAEERADMKAERKKEMEERAEKRKAEREERAEKRQAAKDAKEKADAEKADADKEGAQK